MLPNFSNIALCSKARRQVVSALNRAAQATGIVACTLILLTGYTPGNTGAPPVPGPLSLLMVRDIPNIKELGMALLTVLIVEDLSEKV